DPTLDTAPAEAAAASAARRPSRPVPRQLPPPPAAFVGRDDELAALDSLLKEATDADRVLVISAIGGVGGIGKTWLALHWAHEHLDRFPDGQLYANLHGFDPITTPLPASTVVRGFLDALGTDPQEIPADLEAQLGLYRSLAADRRMLVVLDNARDADQVRPLLPGSATCMVVVTCRSHLGALTATHGSRCLALGALPDDEARQVLTRALGQDRTTAEPDAVDALLRRCAGLPLALGIVVARAAARPDFPLSLLAEEIDDATHRLDALTAGDLTTDLRAVFETSYRALDDRTAQVFSLLGLAPGPDISLPAAAGLTGLPGPRARVLLRALEEAHLLQQHTPGRYRMHDLVRLYATERGHTLPGDLSDTALRRLVDFHLHTACTADRLLFPHRQPIRLDPPAPDAGPLPMEKAAALAWFDAEHPSLLAAQELALEQGRDRQAWQLAWTLDAFQRHRGHVRDGLTAWRNGLTAADRLGDPAARATAHWLLGRTRADLDENDLALDHLRSALALFEQVDDAAGQAHAHRSIARVRARQGDHRQALDHAQRALRRYGTLDNPVWEANAFNAVGWNHAILGNHELARRHCTQALAMFREIGYHAGEASALDSLGHVARHTGRYAEALDHYQQALGLCRETGNTAQVADALLSLGAIHQALGHATDARESWQQALDLFRSQHRTEKARDTQERLDALGPNAPLTPAGPTTSTTVGPPPATPRCRPGSPSASSRPSA
ncbi:ATP-binding protein, partial [Streptomyces spongiae]